MGNSFGTLFRISSWGESHGGGIGVVVDGCPPNLELEEQDIQPFLDRRRPGQSKITTPRDESDKVEILSGTFDGKTLGTPISLVVRNKDANPKSYEHFKDVYRPSHADYTYEKNLVLEIGKVEGEPLLVKPLGELQQACLQKNI